MKSNREKILLNKQNLNTQLLSNKRRYSQLSSMISMNVIHKFKNQSTQNPQKKTFKDEINKVIDLIKLNKIGKLPRQFKNLFEIKDKKLSNIIYYQRIAYNKVYASCTPYLEKPNKKLLIKINGLKTELPRKYFLYLTNYILEHKSCRLYSRFKDYQIINDDENEYLIRYYTRMETKITMSYLLNCSYNNDPSIYDYGRDKSIDIYTVKNDFEFLYKVKLKNLKKFVIKDKKYTEIQNLLPNLFPNGKKIIDLLKTYNSKKKFQKIKSRYLKILESSNKLDESNPLNKIGNFELEDFSELYNDDSDDDNYYINYNVFNTQTKIYYKNKRNDSNIIAIEKMIEEINDLEDKKNNNKNKQKKAQSLIKLKPSKNNNKNINTEKKNEELQTINKNIANNDILKNKKINLFLAEISNKNYDDLDKNAEDNLRYKNNEPNTDRLYLIKNSKTKLLRLNDVFKNNNQKNYYFPFLNNINKNLNKSSTTNKINSVNLKTDFNSEKSYSINKTQNSVYILKSINKTINNYKSSSTFHNFKPSSEFLKSKLKREKHERNNYFKLKNLISNFVKERNKKSKKKYFLNHSIKREINSNKYLITESIGNMFENGEEKDTLIRNIFTSSRIIKKNNDLEREQKKILNSLTCFKDIAKFGDIYK